jgi:hypothetical protein
VVGGGVFLLSAEVVGVESQAGSRGVAQLGPGVTLVEVIRAVGLLMAEAFGQRGDLVVPAVEGVEPRTQGLRSKMDNL